MGTACHIWEPTNGGGGGSLGKSKTAPPIPLSQSPRERGVCGSGSRGSVGRCWAGFTPGCDHAATVGENMCVTCWAPLLSRDKAQRLSTPGPPPAPPHRLHRAGWRRHAGPSTHARHRVLILDDDLPQEAPLIVLVHSEAGRQGLPAVLSGPGRPGGERGRGQHQQTAAPWSLVTTGYPGRQPSPPAMWGLPPGA